jgi:hypothetical protein
MLRKENTLQEVTKSPVRKVLGPRVQASCNLYRSPSTVTNSEITERMMSWACDSDGEKENFGWETCCKMTTWKTIKYMME